MALWQYIFWGQAIYFDDALHGVSITVNQIFFTVRILFNKLFCKNEIPISDSRQVYWEGMILSNVDYSFLYFQNVKKSAQYWSYYTCRAGNSCTYFSMTSRLTHDVAHSTRHSFSPKTNNQPFKKFLSLPFSWVKVIKNWTSF